MNRIKLFFQYRKMLRTVRTVPMYDGRGQGTDVYVCSDCGRKFYTEYKDKGCTPFTIRCRFCKEGTMTHDHTIDHAPVFKQFRNLNPAARQHVLDGGLMLEDEL